MRWKGLVAVLGLIVLTDAWVLVGVARNRSGEPDAVLKLNEREFNLRLNHDENTGASLFLQTSSAWYGDFGLRGKDRWTSGRWFDRAKLEEIGFDCSTSLEDPDALLRYQKMLPKEVFAVAEFDGQAWADWQTAEEERLEELQADVEAGESTPRDYRRAASRFDRAVEMRSRLFIIDAGLDPDALRGRYPDRTQYLILPAVVRLNPVTEWGEEREERYLVRLEGRIVRLLVAHIHVPRPLRPVLDDLLPLGEDKISPYERILISPDGEEIRIAAPRYAVTLKVGRRNEPWIEAIRALPPPAAE